MLPHVLGLSPVLPQTFRAFPLRANTTLADTPPGELLRSVAEPDIFKIALSLGSFDFTRSLTASRYVQNNSFQNVRQGWCKQ